MHVPFILSKTGVVRTTPTTPVTIPDIGVDHFFDYVCPDFKQIGIGL